MKYYSVFFLALIVVPIVFASQGCNSNKKNDSTVGQVKISDHQITEKDIDTLDYIEYILSDEAEQIVSNWLKFQELTSEMEILKKADLNFFEDDKELLKGFVEELRTQIPDTLNNQSILVRLSALETTMYKLHDESIYNKSNKQLLLSAIKQVLIGYTNLIFQINKKLEKDAQQINKPQ